MERNSVLFKKIAGFLALKKSMAALFMMVVFVGMGEKLAERFLPKYIEVLGGGALAIGLLNGLDNLLSALYSLPGGYLSDLIGFKKALVVFNIFAMCGYLIVIFFPGWQAAVIGAIFFISWDALSLPATMSMVSKVLPDKKRTMGVTMHSLVRRLPMALGPLIGGYLINRFGVEAGIRYAFMGAFALAAISLVMQQLMMEEDPGAKDKKDIGAPWAGLFSKRLRVLLASDILIRFCEQIPYAFIVLWCLGDRETGITAKISAFDFGILTAVEMTAAILIYIPVAHFADRGTKKPFIVATFAFFTAFPAVLYFSHTFTTLVFAFIIRGFKEFGEPTRKALILDLVPKDHRAYTYGVYYLIRDIIVSFAAFGGAFLWRHSPALNLGAAFAFGLIGTIYFALAEDNKYKEHDQ
ncbi:MAG: MFS transporter [Candidatus Wallbacteria bacterium GWC2_49_35]|uniref:MFS transporter n=1 Tax=Candidatus Wallbacteria bacterium GWC2_49_35 TaxID=1817813 RepID=A0A1F7WU51_9BACT|nr:MAG: MFS transporter [Candidatus Wallbacteria bacterium GWC2_49_35]